jgi:hypothetical protein
MGPGCWWGLRGRGYGVRGGGEGVEWVGREGGGQSVELVVGRGRRRRMGGREGEKVYNGWWEGGEGVEGVGRMGKKA